MEHRPSADRSPRRLDPTTLGRVVVIAAHPDDATRAVDGLMRRVHDAGGHLALVVTADGPVDFGEVPVHHVRGSDTAALTAALTPLLRDADAYLAPWHRDPRPDHAALGSAAAAAAPVTACGFGYPVTGIASHDPSIPWSDAYLLDDGDEVVFRVPRVTGAPLSRFDELYGEGDGDPWQTRGSWYERRKRATVLACLPAERYRHAAEPACGTGALTRELAARCDRLDASDFSAAAVAQTAAATSGLGHVEVTRAVLPGGAALPSGIDLAVLGEVLYYLSDADLAATVDRLAEAVALGGDVVLVHWDGWPAEAPRDGAAAHRAFLDDPRFEPLVEHVDEEFLVHVLRRW